MNLQLARTSLALCFALLVSACVTIDINPAQITPADDYKFSDPKTPFENIKAEDTDHAWQSKKTGNTIAIITACNKNAEPSLKTFENDTLASLSQTEIISSEKALLSKTDAVKTLVQGELDAVVVRVLFYTTKKANCTYSLAYVARKQSFDSELSLFETFAKGFEFE